jgi:hypothetical protein
MRDIWSCPINVVSFSSKTGRQSDWTPDAAAAAAAAAAEVLTEERMGEEWEG